MFNYLAGVSSKKVCKYDLAGSEMVRLCKDISEKSKDIKHKMENGVGEKLKEIARIKNHA